MRHRPWNQIGGLAVFLLISAGAAVAGQVKVSFAPSQLLEQGPLWALQQGDTLFPAQGAVHQQIVTVPAGTYELVFADIDGWVTPYGGFVEVPASGLVDRTVTFHTVNQVEEVTVNLGPAAISQQNPLWALFQNGVQVSYVFNNGATALVLPGTYDLAYSTFEGWVSPAVDPIVVELGQPVSINADYREGVPVTVTFDPEEVDGVAPLWAVVRSVDGEEEELPGVYGGGDTAYVLPGVEYDLIFTGVQGWVSPNPAPFTAELGQPIEIDAEYQLGVGVTLTFDPEEVDGAAPQWAVVTEVDGEEQQLPGVYGGGQTAYVLPDVEYDLIFSGFDGWLSPNPEPFTPQLGQPVSITATYREVVEITVNFEPEAVRTAGDDGLGPVWGLLVNGEQVSGFARHGETISAFPGSYVIGFLPLVGWFSTAGDPITLEAGNPRTITVTWVDPDLTELTIHDWSLDSGTSQPTLAGTVSHKWVDVKVEAAGVEGTATVLDDGKWYLEPEAFGALTPGDYPVTVTASEQNEPSNSLTATATIRIRTAEPFTDHPTDAIEMGAQEELVVSGLLESFQDLTYDRYALVTDLGTMELRVDRVTTPLTANNFARYQAAGAYEEVIIHRSARGGEATVGIDEQHPAPANFVLQAGNIRVDSDESQQVEELVFVDKGENLINEYGEPNVRGTIAMAKVGGDPNSASSEWFLNLVDNTTTLGPLNNGGFTVFGELVDAESLAVMDALAQVPRWNRSDVDGSMGTVPLIDYSPGDSVVDHVVRIDVERLPPELSFAVASEDPAVISAAIVDGELVLSAGCEAGTAMITVTATAPDGRQGTWQAPVSSSGAVTLSGTVAENGTGAGGVMVFVDLDNNGDLDDGEPRVETAADDPATANEDESGRWVLQATPGAYPVRVMLPAGASSSPVTFAFDCDNRTVDFVVSGVSRQVYRGLISDGTTPTPGIVVYFDENDSGMLEDGEPQTTSDDTGRWELNGLQRGHTVRLALPDGIFAVPVEKIVDVSDATADFVISNTRAARIRGFVDGNDNQEFDDGETEVTDLPVEAWYQGRRVATAAGGLIPGLLQVDYEFVLRFDTALALGYLAADPIAVDDDGELVVLVALTPVAQQPFSLVVAKGWNLVSLPGVPMSYAPLGDRTIREVGRRMRRVATMLSLRAYWLRSDDDTTIQLTLYADPRSELPVPRGVVGYGVKAILTPSQPVAVWNGRRFRIVEELAPGQGALTTNETEGATLPVE